MEGLGESLRERGSDVGPCAFHVAPSRQRSSRQRSSGLWKCPLLDLPSRATCSALSAARSGFAAYGSSHFRIGALVDGTIFPCLRVFWSACCISAVSPFCDPPTAPDSSESYRLYTRARKRTR